MPRALFALLVAIVAATVYFCSKTWLPTLATNNQSIDHQLTLNFILLGIVFCATQIALGLFLWKYRANSGTQAMLFSGQPDARVELTWLTLAAVLFLGLSIAGAVLWPQRALSEPALETEQLRVDVQAVQFRWYFHYPGADGKFGRTKPELIDAAEGNPLGLDRTDPNAADDFVSTTLVVANAADVELTLHAQDVIHSFYVPAFRIKQDAVPGQAIVIHLGPRKEGTFDIACAQLCGMGHYQMNAKLKVLPYADLQKWLAQSAPPSPRR